MIGERGLELGGHQAGIAGGVEEVVEAGEKLVALGVVENEAATDPATEREEIGAAKALDEASVAGEHDAEELTGIEGLAGEHA